MSVQEIKEQLIALPGNARDEVMAFLFHLRQEDGTEYPSDVARRMKDTDDSNWLSPDEFEQRLDAKASR